ncbi:MAG: hypothetical protein JW750_06255 [Anaerolineaceae bacterium]|nr:hypothetical protein [Anaerolineaceae bacterium]
MKLSERSEVLLDRYLLGIERKLPLKGRKDLSAEIRSNLMDMIEDRFAEHQGMISDTELEPVLRAFGSPKSVAQAYTQDAYVIGPQSYSLYMLILRIVLIVSLVGTLVAGLIGLPWEASGPTMGKELLELIASLWGVAVSVVGSLTIVFFILQRTIPDFSGKVELEFKEEMKEDWQIDDLPQIISESWKVETWEQIVSAVFSVIGLIVINFYLFDVVGIWFYGDSGWSMIPLLTDEYMVLIPWINLRIVLGLALALVLIRYNRHTLWTRISEIGLGLFDITLLGFTLERVETLFNFDLSAGVNTSLAPEAYEALSMLFQPVWFKVFFIFVIIVTSINLIKLIVNLAKAEGTLS